MIVLAPDQAVDAEGIGQAIEIGQVGEHHEQGGQDRHREPYQHIPVRRAIIGRDLVPEGVEPEPYLPRIIASFVHHPPIANPAG